MDEKMDHGPIISQFKEEIAPDDNSEILRNRLFEKSAEVLVELLTPYIHGKISLKKQNEEEATYTKIMKKEDGYINPDDKTPNEVERFIRAMQPWPGAWTLIKLTINNEQFTKRLKLLKSHLEEGKLVFDEVQLEGKEPVTWKQFKEGYKEAAFASI